MNSIEFFTDNNGIDIIFRQDGKYNTLSEEHWEIIQFLFDNIKENYPDAFNALHNIYGQAWNFKYLMIRRFAKCNFSVLDDKDDIQTDNTFKLEFVICPLRGECRHEKIICCPKLNTSLSKREIEIMKLICQNLSYEQVADKLFISHHTANNHVKNILRKLNIHDKSGIVAYAHKNNLL